MPRIELHDPTPAKRGRDPVEWKNATAHGCTITFQEWPFEGKAHPIRVDARKKSETLMVAAGAALKKYPYTITPDSPDAPIGPEDEPSISVE